MAKNLFTFTFKKLPVGFLLALLGIFMFESFNILFDRYLYKPPYDGLKMYTENKISQNKKNKFDYIVLGDCYVHFGVMPANIDKITGLTGFNLANDVGQTIFCSYCFLKHYLEKCAHKPKYIILSFLRQSCALTKMDIEDSNQGYSFYDIKDDNELSIINEFGLKNAYVYLIPSLKHQYLFEIKFKNFYKQCSILKNTHKADLFIQNFWKAKGYDSQPDVKDFTSGTYKPEIEKFKVSEFFDKYLRAILDLANSNNIKIIYTIPTDYRERYEEEKSAGAVDAYISYLERLKIEKKNLVIFYPEWDLEQKYLYAYPQHLNYNGTLVLSSDLAHKIIELEGAKK